MSSHLIESTEIAVSEMTPPEAGAWDDFVLCSPSGLPTQLSAWRQIMADTYGHRCYFLLARQAGEIQGLLPLFEVNSPLIGHSLQSLPGAACAGSEESARALVAAADSLARQRRADYLLLRDSRQTWVEAGLEAVEAHRGVALTLPADPELAWKSFSHNVRRDVRHGQRECRLRIEVGPSQPEDFYAVFSEFTARLGVPLFGFGFIQNVARALPENYLIARAYLGDRPIGGYFVLTLGKKMVGMWGASLHDYRRLNVTQQAYWAIIQHGCQAGYSLFDIGRSPFPSAQHTFKARWGDATYPIYQLYRVYRGKTPAALRVSVPENGQPSLSLFRQAWRHLPLPVARAFGPKVRRHIPFG